MKSLFLLGLGLMFYFWNEQAIIGIICICSGLIIDAIEKTKK